MAFAVLGTTAVMYYSQIFEAQAKTDAAREAQLKQLKSTQAEALAKIKQLTALNAETLIVSGLEENIKNLDVIINSLNSAAREQLETIASREKQFTAMRAAHATARRVLPIPPSAWIVTMREERPSRGLVRN